ncbi:MAG: hypothetical protein KKB38_20125, partial [Gammaproteobacteria bacterium]|nr:hypothetical protein [Gammaproteobacteria bacterium]
GTYLYRAGIQLNDVVDKVYYYDFGYNLEELDDLPSVISGYGLYHSLKLVADIENQYYKRFLFNQTLYDMSTYAINATAASSQPHVLVGIDLKGRSGQNDYCHLGGVIVTQDEP